MKKYTKQESLLSINICHMTLGTEQKPILDFPYFYTVKIQRQRAGGKLAVAVISFALCYTVGSLRPYDR